MWANFGFKSSLLMLLLGLFSCSTLYQRKHSDECGAFFENIKQNWAYNPSTKMYEWKNGAMSEQDWRDFQPYMNCLVGLSKKEIEKVIGVPNRQTKYTWDYDYGKPLLRNTTYHYGIIFDSLGKSIQAGASMGSAILDK